MLTFVDIATYYLFIERRPLSLSISSCQDGLMKSNLSWVTETSKRIDIIDRPFPLYSNLKATFKIKYTTVLT